MPVEPRAAAQAAALATELGLRSQTGLESALIRVLVEPRAAAQAQVRHLVVPKSEETEIKEKL